MKVTIEIPETVTFVRAGVECEYALASLPVDMIAELAAHGLIQKVGDAAAGKSGDEATAAMAKVHDALTQGNWGVKRATGSGGDGLDDLQRTMVAVADESITAKTWKAKIDGWADMSTPERRAAKWALISAHDTTDLEKIAKRRMAEAPAIKIDI